MTIQLVTSHRRPLPVPATGDPMTASGTHSTAGRTSVVSIIARTLARLASPANGKSPRHSLRSSSAAPRISARVGRSGTRMDATTSDGS